MSNINFLHDTEKNTVGKKQKSREEIIWSKPTADSLATKQQPKQENKTILGVSRTPLVAPQKIKKGFFVRLFGKKEPKPMIVTKEASQGNKMLPEQVKKEESFWHNPEILETNLIKDEIIFFFDWKKNVAILLFFVFLSSATIALAYFWLDSWGKRKEVENQSFISSFAKLQSDIRKKELEMAEISVFKNRISAAKTLLDNHVYWTNFFEFLEKNTIGEVYYTGGFSGNNKGQYSISAKTKNFNILAEQIKSLRENEKITDISVSSGDIKAADKESEEELGFTLNFTVDPSIFKK